MTDTTDAPTPLAETAAVSPWRAVATAVRRVAGFVLHPVLFAAYPVLFLFSQNLREQVTIDPLLVPLALATAGAAALLAVLRLAFRNWHPAGLLASAAVGLFFAYGHVWNLTGEALEDQRYLLIMWIALLSAALAASVRLGRHVSRATPALNVMAGALVLFNLFPIVGYQAREVWGSSRPVSQAPPSGASAPLTFGGRDVYYLIFDRYGSERTLREEFQFDNGPFLDELRSRGFYIAEDSTANYLKTALSLASSMNLEYLDIEALEARAASPDDWQPFYEMVRNRHEVDRFLHERGYRFINVGTLWPPTQRNTAADENYFYSGLPEFTVELLGTTLWRAFGEVEPSTVEGAADDPPFFRAQYQHTSFQLDRLHRVSELRGPKFVFAHVLLPHWPYIFDREGNYIARPQQRERGEVTGYVGQVEYANAFILDFVDRVLAVPEDERPIVLIQADEGPPPLSFTENERGFQWLEATQAEIDMKFQILNAYYLPGVDPEVAGLYPDITPVNSFRVVFNTYFGTDYPLLDDRNWVFVDQAHLYDVADVTDRVRDGLR